MSSEIYKAAITVATDSVHFVKLAAKAMKQTEWWKLGRSEFKTNSTNVSDRPCKICHQDLVCKEIPFVC